MTDPDWWVPGGAWAALGALATKLAGWVAGRSKRRDQVSDTATLVETSKRLTEEAETVIGTYRDASAHWEAAYKDLLLECASLQESNRKLLRENRLLSDRIDQLVARVNKLEGNPTLMGLPSP